jgi:hypothetical protein
MRMKSLQYLLSLAQTREFDVKDMLNKLGNDPTVDENVFDYQEELDTILHTIEDLKLEIRRGRD